LIAVALNFLIGSSGRFSHIQSSPEDLVTDDLAVAVERCGDLVFYVGFILCEACRQVGREQAAEGESELSLSDTSYKLGQLHCAQIGLLFVVKL
jgi:hypothetical protein